MSLVLYRKYRPQLFSEIIGQEHIVQTLQNAVKNNMISHAYLFTGPRGSGKTTMARLLAKTINCENRKNNTAEPCNKCSSCLEIMSGKSIDLMEIDAASNRGIEEIRELREGTKFRPVKSKYKVYIIDESHQLTKEAANALLKTLEEPPDYVVFILATTETHKMIPTIISRCQKFDFRKLNISEIVKRLKIIAEKEKIKIDDSALKIVASNSGGSFRDSESLFDQILNFSKNRKEIKTEEIKDLLGLVEMNLIIEFCDLLLKNETSKAIKFINEIIEKGTDIQEFTKSLVNYLRQLLILKIVGENNADSVINGLNKEEMEKMKNQANSFSEIKIQKTVNNVLESENKMRYSSIQQLPLELAVIEITEFKG